MKILDAERDRKRPSPAGWGRPSEAKKFEWSLEDDFGHELDVASFAGADGGGAVEVADGVGDLAKAAAGGANPSFCNRIRGANAAYGPDS